MWLTLSTTTNLCDRARPTVPYYLAILTRKTQKSCYLALPSHPTLTFVTIASPPPPASSAPYSPSTCPSSLSYFSSSLSTSTSSTPHPSHPSRPHPNPHQMFNGFHPPQPPTDAELATQTLSDESSHRFPSFSANDAVTLGLSLRKRFRASSRHAKGKGMVLSIQTVGGHTLFACTVGDLGGIAGVGDVSLDSWACLEVSG